MIETAEIPAGFFERDPVVVAPELVGALLTVDDVTVRLTEVEAYRGEADPASHAYRGLTPRTAAMFGPPGHWYVYLSYGMHYCMNAVCWPQGVAGGVLLRAGEVIVGEEIVRARRPGVVRRDWARGPGRLTKSLGVDLADYGKPVIGGRFGLVLGPPVPVANGPRVGVSGPGGTREFPFRFYAKDDRFVSGNRTHRVRDDSLNV